MKSNGSPSPKSTHGVSGAHGVRLAEGLKLLSRRTRTEVYRFVKFACPAIACEREKGEYDIDFTRATPEELRQCEAFISNLDGGWGGEVQAVVARKWNYQFNSYCLLTYVRLIATAVKSSYSGESTVCVQCLEEPTQDAFREVLRLAEGLDPSELWEKGFVSPLVSLVLEYHTYLHHGVLQMSLFFLFRMSANPEFTAVLADCGAINSLVSVLQSYRSSLQSDSADLCLRTLHNLALSTETLHIIHERGGVRLAFDLAMAYKSQPEILKVILTLLTAMAAHQSSAIEMVVSPNLDRLIYLSDTCKDVGTEQLLNLLLVMSNHEKCIVELRTLRILDIILGIVGKSEAAERTVAIGLTLIYACCKHGVGVIRETNEFGSLLTRILVTYSPSGEPCKPALALVELFSKSIPVREVMMEQRITLPICKCLLGDAPVFISACRALGELVRLAPGNASSSAPCIRLIEAMRAQSRGATELAAAFPLLVQLSNRECYHNELLEAKEFINEWFGINNNHEFWGRVRHQEWHVPAEQPPGSPVEEDLHPDSTPAGESSPHPIHEESKPGGESPPHPIFSA